MLILYKVRYLFKMKSKILEWITFIQAPGQIGNLPICPFAAKAMANKRVEINPIEGLSDIVWTINDVDLDLVDVSIFYLSDYERYTSEELQELMFKLNKLFNVHDKVILESDPRQPFIINGHTTTFNGCYLILVQGLELLNKHADILKLTDYYSYWTKEQYNEVVKWRS